MKNDWKQKLSSRKLWVAAAGFLSMMILYLGGSHETALRVTELVMAGATVLCYLLGEGISEAVCHMEEGRQETQQEVHTAEREEEHDAGHQTASPKITKKT
jgi:predicted DNA repair protein MutK